MRSVSAVDARLSGQLRDFLGRRGYLGKATSGLTPASTATESPAFEDRIHRRVFGPCLPAIAHAGRVRLDVRNGASCVCIAVQGDAGVRHGHHTAVEEG